MTLSLSNVQHLDNIITSATFQCSLSDFDLSCSLDTSNALEPAFTHIHKRGFKVGKYRGRGEQWRPHLNRYPHAHILPRERAGSVKFFTFFINLKLSLWALGVTNENVKIIKCFITRPKIWQRSRRLRIGVLSKSFFIRALTWPLVPFKILMIPPPPLLPGGWNGYFYD